VIALGGLLAGGGTLLGTGAFSTVAPDGRHYEWFSLSGRLCIELLMLCSNQLDDT